MQVMAFYNSAARSQDSFWGLFLANVLPLMYSIQIAGSSVFVSGLELEGEPMTRGGGGVASGGKRGD